jgi:hypothetical protein
LLATASEPSTTPATSTSTCTSVSAAVADTALLAANSGRITAAIYNDSTATLYLKLGTGASTTSFTAKVLANGYYELPIGANGRIYSGAINGYWSAANGAARVTELA